MGLLFIRQSSHRFAWLLFVFVLVSFTNVHAQNSISNGGQATGAISSGTQEDTWIFNANAGDSIVARVGTVGFTPRLRLFAPDNTLLQEFASNSSLVRDAFVTNTLPATGTYRLTISTVFPNAQGTYTLNLAQAPGAFAPATGDESGPLANGTSQPGSISVGDIDMWSFNANTGNQIILRAGTTNVVPWLRLYSPSGALIAESQPTSTLIRDTFVSVAAPADGTYIVVITAGFVNESGSYALNLAVAPHAFTTSPGDEGGDLPSGILKQGNLPLGDLDMWSFNANAGDSLMFRVGSTNFAPWLQVIGPNGELAAQSKPTSTLLRDSFVTLTATNAGSYTVIVSATFPNTAGSYGITGAAAPQDYSVIPGDEGGPLTNGIANAGTIDVGDLDLWNFTANAGDTIMLRAGSTNFVPWLRIYGPDGALVDNESPTSTLFRDTVALFTAPKSGNYLVVLSAVYANTSGGYALHLARTPADFEISPGDEGGSLTNGYMATGSITVGDLDMWSFDAPAGGNIFIRMGSTNFAPWLRLYDPSGALVDEGKPTSTLVADSFVAGTATNSGRYTLVASATFANTFGTYGLNLVLAPGALSIAPGDEGGDLINGKTNISTLSRGDLDAWTFVGTPGDTNRLQVISTNFTPWIRLYGPNGALVDEILPPSTLTRSATLAEDIKQSGIYTIVVSAGYANQAGTYAFRESRVPPDLNVPETQSIAELTTFTASISAQDPDDPGKLLNFNILSGPAGMTIAQSGATNATLTWNTSELDGPSTNLVTVTVSDLLNARVFVRTNQFTVIVREINTPPQLNPVSDLLVDELTPVNVTASATDTDVPVNNLTYSLVAPPDGVTIDSASGAISWVPSELQGPNSYTVTVVVTDDNPLASNETHMSATNAFHIQVREVNLPPALVLPETQIIDEKTTLSVSAAASDADLPKNILIFSLLNGPAGATINPTTGLITWATTEADGPGTNTFTVQVLDNGVPALSASGSFQVIVLELNSAPVLTLPGTQTINELSTLNVKATGTDADLPANSLTYSLVTAPVGMSIDSQTGDISWSPTEQQGPSTNTVSVVLTDNGTPSLAQTNSFLVIVNELNTAPRLTVPSTQTVNELTPFTTTIAAADDDVPVNTITFSLLSPPTGMTINPSTGAINWTPTEAQGPSTNLIQVIATDNGSPMLSTTNSFTLIVSEVNNAPQLAVIENQSVHFGIPITTQAIATDSDLPANKLTYSIDQGPQGLTINSSSGAISWTPAEADLGPHSVTVRVTDDATPSASATTTFQITVAGEGSNLSIQKTAGLMQLTITGDINQNYEIQKSTDLKSWGSLLQFQLTTSPYQYIDADPATNKVRFYRLKLLQ